MTKPDGERIVQRPDATLVWAVGAVGLSRATQPEPTTAPHGKIFAGWNTSEVGNGVYPAGATTFPAGNLRLYAQWTDDTLHVEDGSVTVEGLRVEGNASGVYESAAATVTYVYEAQDQGGVTPQPPVVHPPGAGTLPPSGGLANTGLGARWPLAVVGDVGDRI
ncbi:InlB B-repeat-containing protein [Leucobacter luti]|uniref:InlB B-repeat-containing protein n=1 Tax=Leucobacter luti TaxID=340320 RepID=UPI001C68E027|nr:InlB B-repeat-containing protein [Leucobacter luti]QYM75196.1 InlB B-repeat-containing protein [Leucobacter luti]